MTRASAPKYAPSYDLFKLIVAAILTILLILLLSRGPTEKAAQLGPLPTATLAATVFPTATATPSLTPTPLPAPTLSLRPTAQAFPTSDPGACPSSPSHVQICERVRVRSWLNFRSGPGLNWPIIHTNTAGTTMDVIGGPFCTTRDTAEGPKAYLWWNVRMENGQMGWSAEAPLIVRDYFLEPVQ